MNTTNDEERAEWWKEAQLCHGELDCAKVAEPGLEWRGGRLHYRTAKAVRRLLIADRELRNARAEHAQAVERIIVTTPTPARGAKLCHSIHPVNPVNRVNGAGGQAELSRAAALFVLALELS